MFFLLYTAKPFLSSREIGAAPACHSLLARGEKKTVKGKIAVVRHRQKPRRIRQMGIEFHFIY